MASEDLWQAERRLLATGRDGNRSTPREAMIHGCIGSPIAGVLLGLIGWWLTRGTGTETVIVREGITEMAVGCLLLSLPLAALAWVGFEWLAKWYLTNAPYPNVLRYRFLRYRVVFPAMVLFFAGAALVLGTAYVLEGGDLVELMTPPQWR